MDWVDDVVRDVAELDYNSPVDQPSVMLVTASELRAIIEARAPTRCCSGSATSSSSSSSTPSG